MKLLSSVEKWDRWLYGKGTGKGTGKWGALPRDVRAISFFYQDFVPDVPTLTIILVKSQ